MELSYDEVRRIHRLEKGGTKLVEVVPEFYNELNAFLRDERKNYLESLKTFSIPKARNFTNLKKMVEEIFSLRAKKVVERALIASRTNEISLENMALQERDVFNSLLAALNKHNSLLEGLFADAGAIKEKRGGGEPGMASVKILADIPSFVGTDMKEYGPFSANQTVALPGKIAKLLSARKLGVIGE